jgi:hypothetical protein
VRRVSSLLCLVLLLAAAPARPAEQVMVLIVSADSPVTHLDVIEVRKLFLGLSVMRNELSLRALDNRSDDRLWQAFLQNVIAMPEGAYERRVLLMALQQGARRPQVFTATPALLSAVAADRSAVGVAWATDVAQDRRIKVLRVLWRD